MEETESYKIGYELGGWMYHNPIVSIAVGVVISIGFVWLLTKIAKQIRTFGE